MIHNKESKITFYERKKKLLMFKYFLIKYNKIKKKVEEV